MINCAVVAELRRFLEVTPELARPRDARQLQDES
tara:strand:- start:65 stop:166 length:102 start_codon:yes stop_codon:yes gene_type:complete